MNLSDICLWGTIIVIFMIELVSLAVLGFVLAALIDAIIHQIRKGRGHEPKP